MSDGDPKPKISSDQVLGDAPGSVKPREPSLPTRGMKLLFGIGLLATLATILIVVKWMAIAPVAPSLQGVADIGAAIKNYKDLSDLALDGAIRMFDTVVVKVLLPVFTTILGYVFGSRNAG